MPSGLILAVLVLVQQAPPDVPALRERARRAEARYERAARRLAPVTGWARGAGECDEVVGRFCLRFDDGIAVEPPAEPGAVTDARRAAIDSLRRLAGTAPAELAISGPLVRLLIEDDRAAEAVAAALTYEAMTADSVWGALLAGLALHHADDPAAALRLTRAVDAMAPDARARANALDWLLEPGERRRYRALGDSARERYEQRVWRLADPLFLTVPNERRTEHLARYAYARLLERAPVVRDMQRWGRDLEELTIRYGVAHRRGRELGNGLGESSIVEYFDPDQLAYVPADLLTKGMPPQPPPGADWPLAAARARSGHAPRSVRSMEALPHQLSRIPVPAGWLVRVDARFGLDSLARVPPAPLPGDTATPPAPVPERVRAGLWLLAEDGAGADVAVATTVLVLEGDSASLALEVAVPAEGAYVYSAEAYEPATRTARRARYAIDVGRAGALRSSDVIVAAPFAGAIPAGRLDPRLRPLVDLSLAADAAIGVYAEVAGLGVGAYTVEVSIRPADRGSLPGRLVRWLGRSLGVSRPAPPPRVVWTAEHTGSGPAIVAVDLPLTDLDEGLHVIEITVAEARSGARATGQRMVRVEERR